MPEICHWDDADFKKETSEGLALADFYAEWCGPCKVFAATLEQIAAEAPEGIRIGKVDITSAPAVAAEFRVTIIPTVMILKNGEAVYSRAGIHSKDEVLALLKKYV